MWSVMPSVLFAFCEEIVEFLQIIQVLLFVEVIPCFVLKNGGLKWSK